MTKNSILFLIASFFFVCCKKDNNEVYTQAAKDAVLGERLIVDVLQQISYTCPNFIANEEDSVINGINLSVQPALSDSAYPKTITIDYGIGITGILGKMRKGKIIVVINSKKFTTEDLAVSFNDYSSDGSEIWGHINYIYNISKNGYNGELLEDGISIINANGTMKLDGIFSFEKTSTSGTSSLIDDSYDFQCTTTGIDFEQTSFSYNSSSSHSIEFSCKDYITSGTSIVTPHEKKAQTVNFGSGNCDSNVVIELKDGSQKNFTF
jgi:hypothetical protein